MEIKFNGVVHCAELNKSPLGTLVCRKDEVFEKVYELVLFRQQFSLITGHLMVSFVSAS